MTSPTKQERIEEFKYRFLLTMDNFFEHQLFQEYLQEIHGEDYTGLDDDMPEAFQDWQADMDRSEMLQHFTDFITK